jgi:PIN domain nuclease of toxin-antitoxin system
MRVLIDTHVLLWYLDGETLPKQVIDLLENEDTQRLVSIVSLWELSIKISSKNLQTSRTLPEIYQHLLSEINFEILEVKFSHINTLLTLPRYHNDPFDRLIICQGIAENVTIISADKHFSSYPISLIW